MDKTAAIVTCAFLHKCSPEQKTALLGYLPPEEAELLQELPATFGNPALGFAPLEESLNQIHFSWIGPLLRPLPEADIRLFLASLNQEQAQGVQQQLLFANHLQTLTPLAQGFLRKTLSEKLSDPELLPLPCLPEDRLNILLELDYTELLSLIDLLAMHDLAVEVRHIIDTVKLKKIYSLLSKPQQAYLKTLSYTKEPVSFKKIGLNHWNGDTEALRSIFLQRGLNRLAKALFGHHPSLLWHLIHRLDIERGEMVRKLCSPLDHPRAAPLLSDQITALVDSIKHNTPTRP